MESAKKQLSLYSVGVLVISDTVSAGEKSDASGCNLVKLLKSGHYFDISALQEGCVPDSSEKIQCILKHWVDDLNTDLILTVGGTGFSSRDVTPEATKGIIDREAPHLASRMILGCCGKTPFAVLSRSVCGTRGSSLIVNLPGSKKGSQECFEMIADVIPHAIDQLKDKVRQVSDFHAKIQGSDTERTIKL